MRQKKIRGHKRIQKQIEEWRTANLNLDIDDLKERNRLYVKIWVHPFCDLSITNSFIPPPKRKTKTLILSALLDIYDSWKNELDKMRQPYYLKIWLFEPRFSQSQVVCAIGDMLNYYDKTFHKPELTQQLKTSLYGQLSGRLKNYSWGFCLDEDSYTNDEVGEPSLYKSIGDFNDTKIWFEKLLRKKHRTEKLTEKIGNVEECYYFYKGKGWIGSK